MPLTKQTIAHEAERYGFVVVGYAPGPGTRADIELRDKRTNGSIKIGLWPESTEAELLGLLSTAANELRGQPAPVVSPDAWLM